MERLFRRALSGLSTDLQRRRRARLRPGDPSAAEAAGEALAEERLVQLLLAFVWVQLELGATEAAVGIIQVRGATCCVAALGDTCSRIAMQLQSP